MQGQKIPRFLSRGILSGNDLLSQDPAVQVPSALEGLTAVFGMGTGGSPPPLSPDYREFCCSLKTTQRIILRHLGQALDQLVPVSLRYYYPYTPGLSTSSSLRGLTWLNQWEISS